MVDIKSSVILFSSFINGKYILEFLKRMKIHVKYIVSIKKTVAKQIPISGYYNFEFLAKKYNIPIYYPSSYGLKNHKDLNFFKKEAVNCLGIIGGWQRLIPKNVIECFSLGIIGGHGSAYKLPKGRGRSPVNWSLIKNKKRFILHMFYLSENMDSGNIIDTFEVDINKFDTCRSIYQKLSFATEIMLKRNIKKLLKEKIKGIKQIGIPTYYKKRTPEDGRINWKKKTSEIYNLIRAATYPYPGAFSYIAKKKITIWDAAPFSKKLNFKNHKEGKIIKIFDSEFIVKTGNSSLLIKKYEYGGKLREGMVLT